MLIMNFNITLMKKLIILCILFISGINAFSQFSIKTDIHSEFSIDYKFQEKFRVELGLMSGEFGLNQFTPTFKADLLKRADFDGYIGLGLVGLDPVDIINIPIGMDLYPLNKKNFSIIIEIQNLISDKYEVVGNLGIRYRFNNTKKNS